MEIREAINRFKKAGQIKSWADGVFALYEDEKDYEQVKELRRYLRAKVADAPEEYMQLLRRSYMLTAPDKFDDYMIAMEWDRETKFYLPRRECLKDMVSMLQDLTDDKTDIACCSMPPGVGKSGVGILYCTFSGGRDPLNGIML